MWDGVIIGINLHQINGPSTCKQQARNVFCLFKKSVARCDGKFTEYDSFYVNSSYFEILWTT